MMQATDTDGEEEEEGSFVSFDTKGLPYSSIASGDHDILWDEATSIVATDPEKVCRGGRVAAAGESGWEEAAGEWAGRSASMLVSAARGPSQRLCRVSQVFQMGVNYTNGKYSKPKVDHFLV